MLAGTSRTAATWRPARWAPTRRAVASSAPRAFPIVEVRTLDDKPVTAIAYSVVSKKPHEVKPSPEYLDGLVRGAAECELPEAYQRFLAALRDEWGDRPEVQFRRTPLLRGTASRSEARGMGLVKVSQALKDERSLGRYAAVVYRDRPALAEVSVSDDCDERCCELDQSVRHALGIPGRESFGAHVTLSRAIGRPTDPWSWLIRPHTFVLAVWAPSWADSEK